MFNSVINHLWIMGTKEILRVLKQCKQHIKEMQPTLVDMKRKIMFLK